MLHLEARPGTQMVASCYLPRGGELLCSYVCCFGVPTTQPQVEEDGQQTLSSYHTTTGTPTLTIITARLFSESIFFNAESIVRVFREPFCRERTMLVISFQVGEPDHPPPGLFVNQQSHGNTSHLKSSAQSSRYRQILSYPDR